MPRYYSSSRYRKSRSSSSGPNRFWVWSTVVLFVLFAGTIFFTMKGSPNTPNANMGEGNQNIAEENSDISDGDNTNRISNSNKSSSNSNTAAKNSNANKTSAPKAYIAIIIDDLGNQGPDATPTKTLLSLRQPLTLAVIPDRPKTKDVAEAAKAAGFDVIIHQPMESVNPATSAGEGAILANMSDAQAAEVIEKHITDMPEAVGMNNHLGSKVTQDAELMRVVMKKLKSHGLFFVDSMTISSSKGLAVAKEEGVKAVKRNVFIDGQDNEAYIRQQILSLAESALEKRIVVPVGIGHLRPKTVAVLQSMLPELADMGVGLKKISDVIE